MTYIRTTLQKEIVISELVTIHYFEYMKDFIFQGESHNFWEFLYVDKGCVMVQADDQKYQLDPGDVIFHQPNEFHAIKSLENKAPNLVAVSFCTASPAMDFFIRRHFTLSRQERSMISQIVLEAQNAFSTPIHVPAVEQVISNPDAPFGAQQMISLYLELFLITLRRKYSQDCLHTSSPISSTLEKAPNSERLEQILQYMRQHICERLTVESICREFSLSRSAVQALFHKEKQCGAMEYFNELKLELAKELMRDGTMNLTEIAHYLSFSSLQYFSKQFKKSTGMPPLEYSTSVKGMSQAVKKLPPRTEG